MNHIQRLPRAAAVVYQDVRMTLLNRFPYALLYKVEPQQIVLLAVYHTSRDPRGWQQRT